MFPLKINDYSQSDAEVTFHKFKDLELTLLQINNSHMNYVN